MKAVILAGGSGTRLSEETSLRPKPMVEIGGSPILWHILKTYAFYNVTEFIICCGYKGYMIKEYFANYFLHMSDVTFDMKNNSMKVLHKRAEPWRVTLVDTGENSMTGGRLKKVKPYLQDDSEFCFTYGDGLADLNIGKTINYHKSHGKLATLTATFPPGRFGALNLQDDTVTSFNEKPKGEGGMVNCGYFVLNPKVFDYLDSDHTVWEQEPLSNLAKEGQLKAYHHDGFWQPMDTLRDKNYLEQLWQSNQAPWKIWK